jgi:glucose/arabinose dehydrogenase/cytochrome c5
MKRSAFSAPARAAYAGVPSRATLLVGIALCAAGMLASHPSVAAASTAAASGKTNCPDTNAGIALPPGFCATVFANGIGHARHLVVAPNGVVYVNTWSGTYYGNDKPHDGGFLVALLDNTGSGHADMAVRFGPDAASGNHGGTGIGFYKDALYAETNDRIVRYALPSGAIPSEPAQVVLSGLPLTGDHPMHPFVIDAQGSLYVDLGSATNSCQVKNRTLESPGIQPCTELETRAGTWRYDANRTGQVFSPAERFATGLRNGEGFAFDSAGRLFATQHGRDQLGQNWPKLYTTAEGANEPAEELVQLGQGADFGWPYCYFDLDHNGLMLAPEYGGDGKTAGLCAQKRAPVAAFPAHWAPNDLAIYNGTQFPSAYRDGAFIAFHGSWNRAPLPQAGYNIVFQPMKDGKASGKYVVFADGFAAGHEDPGAAKHRPSGLAIAPDGALYVADDQGGGRIWRITYNGPMNAPVQAAPHSAVVAAASASSPLPPEGIHPDAGQEDAALPVPAGATRADVALGRRIYYGQVAGASCAGCHGDEAKGTPLAPDLTSPKWIWGDGSLPAITKIVTEGVPQPKNFRSPMPPMGGAQLTPQQVKAVAAYVWAISHTSGQ